MKRWRVDVPSMNDFADVRHSRFDVREDRIGRIKRRDDHEIDIGELIESPGRRRAAFPAPGDVIAGAQRRDDCIFDPLAIDVRRRG
ncbi:MAG: hypothetical protein ACXW14_12355 [Burkholderiaceae bacterium]